MQSDLDFAPMYKTKIPHSTYLFLELDSITGLYTPISFSFYAGYQAYLDTDFAGTINWGDGNIEDIELSHTNGKLDINKSHTYSNYGNYVVSIVMTAKTSVAQEALNTNKAYIYCSSKIFNVNISSNTYLKDVPIYKSLKQLYVDYFVNTQEYIFRNGLFNYLETFITNYELQHIGYYTMPCKVPILTQEISLSGSNPFYICLNPLTSYLIIEPTFKRSKHTSTPGFADSFMTVNGFNQLTKFIINGKIYDKDRSNYTNQYSIWMPERCIKLKKIVLIGNVPLQISSSSSSALNMHPVKVIMTDEQKEYDTNYGSSTPQYNFIIPYISKNINRVVNNLATKKAYLPKYCSTAYFINSFEFTLWSIGYAENIFIETNYSNSLDLRAWAPEKEPKDIVYILNQIKDLSQDTSKTLTLNQNKAVLCNAYVKKSLDLYELCNIEDEGSMTIIAAFNQKNWTLSFVNI